MTISYEGFAVDSNENVYVGYCNSDIHVFRDGKLVKKISTPTSRGYDFTILQNDIILCDTGSRAFLLSSAGEILSSDENDYTYSFYKYRENKKVFISSSGNEYRRVYNWGRTKIIKVVPNGEDNTVFIMPLRDYLCKFIFYTVIIGMMIVVPTLIYCNIRIKNDRKVAVSH